MNGSVFIYLSLLSALFFTVGGVLMKSSEGLTRLWPSVFFLSCFMIGALVQALAMRGNAMGTTYVFVLGLEAVLGLGCGAVIFHEPLTVTKLTATALIVTGVFLLRQG
jgi:multidrug transporter EmrE-like cation transporter